jgi:hypothetical protein
LIHTFNTHTHNHNNTVTASYIHVNALSENKWRSRTKHGNRYIYTYIHTYTPTNIHAQLKALSAYGWRGTVTRKKEDGGVELLVNVKACGLRPEDGINGIKDPDNVKSYKTLETVCAGKAQKRAFFSQDFAVNRKYNDLATRYSSTEQEGGARELLKHEDQMQTNYEQDKDQINYEEEDASESAPDTSHVFDAPVVQSHPRTSLDYPFQHMPKQVLNPWAESRFHAAKVKSSQVNQTSPRLFPDFDWWRNLIDTGKGWEDAAVPHYKRRQADVASSIPKTSPDVNLTDASDEIRYIDPLGRDNAGYPDLIHR